MFVGMRCCIMCVADQYTHVLLAPFIALTYRPSTTRSRSASGAIQHLGRCVSGHIPPMPEEETPEERHARHNANLSKIIATVLKAVRLDQDRRQVAHPPNAPNECRPADSLPPNRDRRDRHEEEGARDRRPARTGSRDQTKTRGPRRRDRSYRSSRPPTPARGNPIRRAIRHTPPRDTETQILAESSTEKPRYVQPNETR